MKIETVKIVAKNKPGFVIINKSDFNPSIHKLFEELVPPPKFTIEDTVTTKPTRKRKTKG